MNKPNYAILFIDYYLQHREYRANSEDTLNQAVSLMDNYKSDMTEDEFRIIEGLLERITNISK